LCQSKLNPKNLLPGGGAMTVFFIGSALLGIALSRFFKFYVLAPTSIVVVVLAFACPFREAQSGLGLICSIALLLTSLQLGYFVGLILTTNPQVRLRVKRNASNLHSDPSALSPPLGPPSVRHRRMRNFSRGQSGGDPFCPRPTRHAKRIGPAA
jgi:hypothetical protein